MPVVTKEEYKERMRLGRERAAQERAAGLRPPRKNAKGNRAAGSRTEAPRPAPREDAAPQITPETPEFKAAVDAAVNSAVAAATAQMMQAFAGVAGQLGSGGGAADSTLANLAMQIAELTEQGRGQKRIPAEILLARAEADKRMKVLIEEAAEAGEVPLYRLTSKVVLPLKGSGETLIDPLWRGRDNRVYPTEIRLPGIPNLAMEPVNEWAKRISEAFRESVGSKQITAFATGDEGPDGIDAGGAVTPNGHVVTGSVASMIRSRDRDQRRIATVMNETAEAAVQERGAARYVDVRVLGSIAPPARQNG